MADTGISTKIFRVLKKQALLVVLLLAVIIFSLLSDNFLSTSNILLILKQITVTGILTIGMTYIVIGGNMDLSMGSMVSLSSVITVTLHDAMGPIPAILIALCIGMLCGAVTGFLVGYVGLNGMITSLGMQNVIYSAALIYTGNQYFKIENVNTWFSAIGRGNVMGVPAQVLVYMGLIAIFQLVLVKSLFGKRLIAVGNNPVCANYSGINSRGVVAGSYVISGLCAAMAGVVLTSRSMSGQSNAGMGMEFDALTATILGGTSLAGGSGSVVRSFVGAFIMGILKNGFVLLGLSDYLQWIAQCVIIVLVVWIDISSRKKVTK